MTSHNILMNLTNSESYQDESVHLWDLGVSSLSQKRFDVDLFSSISQSRDSSPIFYNQSHHQGNYHEDLSMEMEKDIREDHSGQQPSQAKKRGRMRRAGQSNCPMGRFNKQTIYRQIYRYAFKPLILRNKKSIIPSHKRPGFDQETKKLLCGDTLQGILLALRQFPQNFGDFKVKLLTLHNLKKKASIQEEKKIKYNKVTLSKIIAILDLMNRQSFRQENSIKTFIHEVTNAGNINQTSNEKDVEKYKMKEERFIEEMKNKDTKSK